MDPALEPYLGALGEGFLSRYEPLQMLGRGACGAVFKARQAALDRPVVVKILHQDLSEIGVLRIRFEREAALLAQLDHPRLVKVIDYGVAGANLFLVCLDDQGISLLQWALLKGWPLGKVPVPPARVERFIGQALEGLEHVHRHGILHRDVKPSNLLVLPDEQLRIIDFGLARPTGRGATLTRTGSIVGTPQYMAPAQIQGLEGDPRDDLYSLGVVAYEMLTGTAPFLGPDIATLMNRQLSFVPPLAHEVVPGVARSTSILVADLLAKSRDDRPASAAEALDRLDPGRTRTADLGPATPIEIPGRRPVPAGPRAPAPPLSPGLKGFGAGLGLATLVTVAAGFFSPHGGEVGPAPAPSPGADRLAAPLLPADLAARATRELEALGGEVERDPARWPGVLAALPAAEGFRRWVAKGGRPEALAAAEREPLVGLDARYRTLGLPSPFHPFLRAPPAPGSTWLDLAVAASERVAAEMERVRAAGPAGRTEDEIVGLGKATRSALKLYRMVTPVTLDAGLRRLYAHSGAVRAELTEYCRPGWEALAELVYAGSRSILEEPATREAAASRLAEAIDGVGNLVLGPDCHDASWALTAGEPATPAGALLAATWLGECAVAHDAAGEDAGALQERADALYRRALGRDEGALPPADRLVRAAWGTTRRLARRGDAAATRELVRALATGLEGQPAEARGKVVRRVLEGIGTDPPATAEGKARVAEMEGILREGLGAGR